MSVRSGRRKLLRLAALLLVLAGPVVLPVQAAWADDGESEGGGGGESSGGGESEGGGGESSGGGGESSGGGSESSGGSGGSTSGGHTSSKPNSDEKDGTLASRLAGKIASLEEIQIIAARIAPGEIVDVRLQRENGRVVYRLKILQKNDRLIVLRLDAKTRKRLVGVSP